MNLKQTMADDFAFFNWTGARKEHQVKAALYIEGLASSTNTRIDSWNAIEVFGHENGKEFLTDKYELNRRFFKQKEKMDELQKPSGLSAEIKKKLTAFSKETRDSAMRSLKSNMDMYARSIVDGFSSITANCTSLAKLSDKYASYEGKPLEDFASASIEKLLESGVVSFFKLSGDEVQLVTEREIILTYKNQAQALDLQVNFGRFVVGLNMRNFLCTIRGHSNNLLVPTGYFHPHVNVHGSVCLGNAAHTYAEAIKARDIEKMVTLILAVLTTYNPGSPYASLQSFAAGSRFNIDSVPPTETVAFTGVPNTPTFRPEYMAVDDALVRDHQIDINPDPTPDPVADDDDDEDEEMPF